MVKKVFGIEIGIYVVLSYYASLFCVSQGGITFLQFLANCQYLEHMRAGYIHTTIHTLTSLAFRRVDDELIRVVQKIEKSLTDFN